ncbi:hypothetical protein FIBSPDRAFT_947128 [Athelia psychrophila]|uniref:Uncharacterized protein n=1 Tax=Athelia psychrophila TaxID=1759441 RepID=A0A166S813_9AGAM|nr:hypothetical protein FIBSPDRAFT_947128 [Fibularhizoctonia sp. CBS 109695]
MSSPEAVSWSGFSTLQATTQMVNVDDVFAGVLQAAPSDKPTAVMNAPSGLPKLAGQLYQGGW